MEAQNRNNIQLTFNSKTMDQKKQPAKAPVKPGKKQENWPSKEPGKKSGPGRENNPPKPKK